LLVNTKGIYKILQIRKTSYEEKFNFIIFLSVAIQVILKLRILASGFGNPEARNI